MQELLGRLRSLDPGAVISLRVIACFDELIVGGVNSRALLSAAASLTGCVVGFSVDAPAKVMRVSPSGDTVPGEPVTPADARFRWADQGLTVWIERSGEPHANDALILERLCLALRLRHNRSAGADPRRDLALMVDADVDDDRRFEAAARQGLTLSTPYRFVVAPLFATWQNHPSAREDVIATPVGPLHTLIVSDTVRSVDAAPIGIGPAATVADFPRSFRTAVVALRLTRLPENPTVLADDYGGLLDVLVDLAPGHEPADVPAIARITENAWGSATLDGLLRTGSVREAARFVGVHHSTLTARVAVIAELLGFDPLGGLGKVRLGLAYLIWRLRVSSALSLPSPVDGIARVS